MSLFTWDLVGSLVACRRPAIPDSVQPLVYGLCAMDHGIDNVRQGVWRTPAINRRPRPVTIHEGFSYGSADWGHQSWDIDSTLSLQQTPIEAGSSRPISVHQDFARSLFAVGLSNSQYVPASSWTKPDETYPFMPLPDMAVHLAYARDEHEPSLVVDHQVQHGQSYFEELTDPRNLSGSCTVSTSEPSSDMHDYPPASSHNSLMGSMPLSPVASPRLPLQGRSNLVRTSSRGCASPSPRPGMRSAPYSTEPRNKRWSTGSFGAIARHSTPLMFQHVGDSLLLRELVHL